ncbi:hypothetical protein GCM10020000_87340 [Streptomyces olivoverticillatus]
MRTSHTFSRHWDLETRQHELLGIDLGEGISRKVLLHGLVVFALWDGALLLMASFPTTITFSLYFLPPIFITAYGTKRSGSYWRRRNFLLWGVTVNYLVNGVKPAIGRGRIPAPRLGWRLRAARLGERFPKLANLPAAGAALAPPSTGPISPSPWANPSTCGHGCACTGPTRWPAPATKRSSAPARERRTADGHPREADEHEDHRPAQPGAPHRPPRVAQMIREASGPLLGLADGDQPVTLNPEAENVLVATGPGGGTTTVLRSLAAQAIARGAVVDVLDPTGAAHAWTKKLPRTATYVRIPELHDYLLDTARTLTTGARRTGGWEGRRVVVLESADQVAYALRQFWAHTRPDSQLEESPAVEALARLMVASPRP